MHLVIETGDQIKMSDKGTVRAVIYRLLQCIIGGRKRIIISAEKCFAQFLQDLRGIIYRHSGNPYGDIHIMCRTDDIFRLNLPVFSPDAVRIVNGIEFNTAQKVDLVILFFQTADLTIICVPAHMDIRVHMTGEPEMRKPF